MNKILNQKILIIALSALVSILSVTNTNAIIIGSTPFNIVLIGNFIPLDEKPSIHTFVLWIKGKKWHFTVTKPHIIGRSRLSGWQLLREILPQKLMLDGDEKIIQSLKQSEVVGKSFKLRDNLYVQSRRFFLLSAEEIFDKDDQPESE